MMNEQSNKDSLRYALHMAKSRPAFADGGPVTGPLISPAGGRTDLLPIKVPSGSYVIPADIVSGLPGAEGSSLAGFNILNKLFGSSPLSPDGGPYGTSPPKLPVGHTIPGEVRTEHHLMNPRGSVPHEANGGKANNGDDWRGKEPVDIMAAGGEYVIHPEAVEKWGGGSLKRGHAVLDKFVDEVRKRNIKDLKKLPGTVKT
jgi:hypothetical protein